ncbi:MAG: hypothetical protein AMK72_13300 [Planctomycetes bacterium SM23_25]|nr:MAG: hypothetical protein AMK72_13300 [Planctomycetes bacterium SM23_25]
MAKRTDKAKWIWIAAECHRLDSYLRARRTFTLAGVPSEARLRVTAFSEYVLYVNGRYVGCGPTPSSARAPLLDVYTAEDLPLRRGRNVIAVLAHNYYVGLPRLPRLPAGLWLQLDATYANGKAERLGTDRRWRLALAEDFSRRAPRVYWTTGFTEVRDTRREPQGWTEVGFNDRRWAKADEVRHALPEGFPPQKVREQTAPRLTETFVVPSRLASSGWAKWQMGMTAIPFEFAVPNPAHGEFYAGTFVRSHRRQKARFIFDCDEAAAVYFNNRQVIRQGYSEQFVHWLQDEEHDHYTGIHRGQGHRTESADVTLGTGWNSVGIVIYDPGRSWGFAVRFEDARTGKTLPLEFSPDLKAADWVDWQIIIDQLCPCGKGALPEVPTPNERTFPDPAYQLAWEERTPTRRAPAGAAALAAGGRGKGPLRLRDGERVTYDFGDERVGHVELDVEGAPGAILDVAWGEGLGADGCVEPVRGGMRQVDRLILRRGRQTVRFVNRRALRYLELVARTGGDRLKVYRLGVHATGRGTEPPAAIDTGDRRLANAMRVVERTVHRCLQRTLEGSPARDAEQSIPAAYLLAQAERTLYGRTDLGEAALQAFADDQRDDGFFRAIVPAGTVHTVPDWNLLWIIWLADHVAWTGDRRLAKRLYPVAEKCLEWTAGHCGLSGLLENKPRRSPWWLFLDHSPIDRRGEVTAWQALWCRALRTAADVAEFLGDDQAAARGRAEADAVAETARARLWDKARGLFVDGRLYDNISDTSTPATNYYALYGGLATPHQADQILANLWKTSHVESANWGPRENPYVKSFALEALLELGRAEQALAMIRSYWGDMAKAGLSTVPEVFPLPADGQATPRQRGSPGGPYNGHPPWVLCHGCGVAPAAMVAKWILGVRPGRPGFEPLHLAPMPGDLRRISGRAWTPQGPVEIAIEPARGRRKIRAVLPDGLSYRLDRRHLDPDDEVEVVGGKPAEA